MVSNHLKEISDRDCVIYLYYCVDISIQLCPLSSNICRVFHAASRFAACVESALASAISEA